MKRMMAAIVITCVSVAVFLISYAVLAWPLEYIVDGLIDVYPSIPNTGHSISEFNNVMISLVYFFAAAVLIGIILLFVWLFAFAHKKEFEQY